MSEQLVWTEEEAAEMKERFQRRFGEPLPRTESLFAVAAVGYRKGLNTRPSPTEIEALREELKAERALKAELLEALQWYEAKSVQMGRAAIHQDSKLLLELMKEIAVEYGARARAAIAKATGEQP